ncbi:porin family protein [Tenacibaculum sp. ZS6-P6]|uniref:porin family protein n=1 Tax=Tenacibaculum sp. ZS6-P6 TaxID=3447503 RepID=UPI003F9B52C8
MKKIFTIALFTVSLLCVDAQSINFGVKGGVNFSTLRGDNLDVDSKTGFHIGGIAELKIVDKFSVQPELLFTQLGTSGSQRDFKTSYISLPVMAKYYVFQGLAIEAGPQVSFLIDDELKRSDGTIVDTNVEDFDFGLNFGVGYNFNNGIFFQTRYTLGITTVQENPDVKNGAFQLSLGYQF